MDVQTTLAALGRERPDVLNALRTARQAQHEPHVKAALNTLTEFSLLAYAEQLRLRALPSERTLRHLFGDYVEWSLRYYAFDESVVPDHEFDTVCQTLLEHWDRFDHRLKHLITPDDLRSGTGYGISTSTVPGDLIDLIRQHPGVPLRDVFPRTSQENPHVR